MRNQDEIRRFVENKYREFLRSVLTGEAFFPLEIPFGRLDPTADLGVLIDAVRELIDGSKLRQGFGYNVVLAESRTRRNGLQRLPERVWIESEDDFVRFLKVGREVAVFRANVAATRAMCPELEQWLLGNLTKLREYADVWPSLLSICTWFIAHPRPQCFAREIPVNVHTKFIEEHEAVLGSLLTFLLPNDHDPLAGNFHSRFFLKDKEALIRVRFADPTLCELTGLRLTDFAVPVTAFHSLPFDAAPRVLVIENEITFLTFPPMPEVVLVWGMGNAVHLIADAVWLRGGERIVYWGDVDTRGVTILAWLRRKLPLIKSVLMDKKTLETFPDAEVEDPSLATTVFEDAVLSDSEWECFRTVSQKQPRRRLEQERIPFSHALPLIEHGFRKE